MKKLKTFLSLCSIIGVISCATEKAEPDVCGELAVSFQTDIKPIIEASCKFESCHLEPTSAPYVMEPLSEFQDFTQNNQSKFFAAIEHTGGVKMPKFADKLPDSSIAKLKCWVLDGSKDN